MYGVGSEDILYVLSFQWHFPACISKPDILPPSFSRVFPLFFYDVDSGLGLQLLMIRMRGHYFLLSLPNYPLLHFENVSKCPIASWDICWSRDHPRLPFISRQFVIFAQFSAICVWLICYVVSNSACTVELWLVRNRFARLNTSP